jgi:ketosteroid isomerase-like protein
MKTASLCVILSLLFLISCQKEPSSPASQEEAITQFKKQFNLFYDTYSAADISFVETFTEDVISMDTNGELMTGRDAYRESMVQMFDTYEIDLLNYTEPGIIYSPDQIVTYNDYEELFIHKETGDTTRVHGTWLGIWQKENNEWKVKMNTFHTKDE